MAGVAPARNWMENYVLCSRYFRSRWSIVANSRRIIKKSELLLKTRQNRKKGITPHTANTLGTVPIHKFIANHAIVTSDCGLGRFTGRTTGNVGVIIVSLTHPPLNRTVPSTNVGYSTYIIAHTLHYPKKFPLVLLYIRLLPDLD